MKRQFAFEIGHRLRDLDETVQREWWNVWLRDYWANRLQGVPYPLAEEEITQMLEWVMDLPGVFPEAVEMAIQMRRVHLSRSHILYDLSKRELSERYPDELARFLVHLGQNDTEPWFWLGTREVFDQLLAKDLPVNLKQELRELMVRHNLG